MENKNIVCQKLNSLYNRFVEICQIINIRYQTIRSKRNLILVHLQETGLREHVEPLILWLMRTNKFIIIVVVVNQQLKPYSEFFKLFFATERFVRLTYRETFSRLSRLLLKPQVILSIHPETVSPIASLFAGKSVIRVVMPHGLSDKGDLTLPNAQGALANCDIVFLSGQTFLNGSLSDYINKNPKDRQRLKLLKIGSPKTDLLLNSEYSRDVVLRDLGLNPELKTVCYAPTYNRCCSLEQCGTQIINALNKLDINVIVKLHHISLKTPETAEPWYLSKIGHKDWKKILNDMEQQYANMKMVNEQNANPYLVASDVLVSDASGVAYEFLMLNRPIIFYDVPDLFKKFGTQGISYWGRKCGDIVSNTDELVAAINYVLDNPNHKKKERETLIEKLVYNKGKATEVAGQTILNLIQQNKD